jgi:hypothetical protein
MQTQLISPRHHMTSPHPTMTHGHPLHVNSTEFATSARKRVVFESYDELNRYLAPDARAGFQRILRDPGGHLVLTPIPAQLQQEHSPFSANSSVTVEHSPRSYHRAHRYTSSLTSTTNISTISSSQHRFCLSTIRSLKKLKDAGAFD